MTNEWVSRMCVELDTLDTEVRKIESWLKVVERAKNIGNLPQDYTYEAVGSAYIHLHTKKAQIKEIKSKIATFSRLRRQINDLIES